MQALFPVVLKETAPIRKASVPSLQLFEGYSCIGITEYVILRGKGDKVVFTFINRINEKKL